MQFDDIFTAYYNQYRAEAEVPASTDDEYTIGLRLANEAIQRWANYDNTFWAQLWTTLAAEDETQTVATAVIDYDAPANFVQSGGDIKVLDSDNKTIQTYKLIPPEDVQFKPDLATYAYFTGSPVTGYTLHLNPAPSSSLAGNSLEYVYYKSPTLFEGGTDVTEMTNAYFIVHRMLANRFRASRNPYYTDALRDAEDALRTMKMQNDSGNWSNPWSLADRSGTTWGS